MTLEDVHESLNTAIERLIDGLYIEQGGFTGSYEGGNLTVRVEWLPLDNDA